MPDPIQLDPVLSFENVWKTYDSEHGAVVQGVSFDLAPGEILALLGPSGCGKTTTLRLIAGFEDACSGTISLACHPVEDPAKKIHVPPQERGIGFVFQDYALFPHMSVIENVKFGLKKLPRKMRTRVAEQALARVGLANYANRRPHELSGGQQQRVALARSFAPRPKVILLDEPFSNFDAALRADARREVRNILKNAGTSAIFVTHDQEEALTIADRVAVMNEGRIEQIGDPVSVYRNPATQFVASFLGATNLLRGRGQGDCAHCQLGCVRVAGDAQGDVMLSIRPEQLAIVPRELGDFEGVIEERQFKGHDQLYRVRTGDASVVVMTDHASDYASGETVSVRLTEPAIVLSGSTD